jgi:hypothetical protein
MTVPANQAEQFDFTDAQWQAIRNAVLDGCHFPLTFDDDDLRSEAQQYLQRMQSSGSPSVEKKKWKRLQKQLAQARGTLMTVASCDYREFAHCKVFLGVRDGWHFHEEDLDAGRLPVINISAVLDEWILLCADRVKHCARPRDIYINQALCLWAWAGGRFQFSRAKPGSQQEGRPGGPTIRFLEAVSLPLMGKAAPSGETFAKIVEQRARRPGMLDPRLAKHFAKLEATLSPAQARRIVRAISRLTDPR